MIARNGCTSSGNSERSGVASENAVIAKLIEAGIPAKPGKAVDEASAWTDVVAFDSIPVEVKEARQEVIQVLLHTDSTGAKVDILVCCSDMQLRRSVYLPCLSSKYARVL